MSPAEIHEASRLLSSLDGLRKAVSELDFPHEQIAARGMSISFSVRAYSSSRGSGYPNDLVKCDNVRDDEMVAAVLAITRRRRKERLAAALRRLAQLGVVP